mmetsp:Transcript_21917/g.30640  ORF Transcript_21917/g.30640 Transcript_21917/m.30640 type:complete len:208 (-) Transcript_21917:314-937(-)
MVYLYTLAKPGLNGQTSVSTWWLALFHVVSAFNNVGLSLFPDSFIRYRSDTYLVVVFCLLILAGNVAFPIFLRIIIWALDKIHTHFHRPTKHHKHDIEFSSQHTNCSHPAHPTSRFRHRYQVFDFLLTFPRQCYTHLFPSYQTKWLVLVISFLVTVQFILSIILGWSTPAYKGNNGWTKILMCLFDSVSIRTSGLTTVDQSLIPPAL